MTVLRGVVSTTLIMLEERGCGLSGKVVESWDFDEGDRREI